MSWYPIGNFGGCLWVAQLFQEQDIEEGIHRSFNLLAACDRTPTDIITASGALE
jgi:hypothetical protein